MRLMIQRVTSVSVTIDEKVIGAIGKGFLVFIGIALEDTREIAAKMMDKMLRLRIFSDENDKINLSLADVGGALLLVSQFTLYADCRKGNRPSFIGAAPPKLAEELYAYAKAYCAEKGFTVQSGIFGADMQV